MTRTKLFETIAEFYSEYGKIWAPRRIFKQNGLVTELHSLYPNHEFKIQCRLAKQCIYPAPFCNRCGGKISDPTVAKFCSTMCSNNDVSLNKKRLSSQKVTNIERYGVEWTSQCPAIRKKQEITCLNKYGTSSPLSNVDVQEKAKQTRLSRYGTEYTFGSDQIKEKIKKTNLKRYGFDNPSKSVVVKEKIKQHFNKKYRTHSYPSSLLSDETRSILEDKDTLELLIIKWGNVGAADLLNINVTSFYNHLRKQGLDSYISRSRSLAERKIENYLINYNLKYIANDRTAIAPKELDFYFPDHNAAIEINGIYWHSDASPAKRSSHYHFDKWKKCRDLGISLYSYTDTDVLTHFDKIISKVNYILSTPKPVIGARKCKIQNVNTYDEFALLNANHIQGSLMSRQGKLGAYYDNNLVAIINWAKRKHYLEITRYCCDTNASYPGLFSKMMKAMLLSLNYAGQVVSFSNNDHSNGGLYKSAGFTEDKILGPAYWYTSDFRILESRQKYMKSKIEKLFNVNMRDKTEYQAMQELGFSRYYDSGKIKWTMVIK